MKFSLLKTIFSSPSNHFSAWSESRLFLFLVIAGLLIRIAYALYTPTFYAPDESPHFKFIRYIAEEKKLPIQTSKTGDLTDDWEYYHPPLYYIALSPVYWVMDKIVSNDSITVRALRICTVAFWLLSVWLVWRFLLREGNLTFSHKTFIMCVFCFLPTYTFSSSMINNDNLAIFLGCVAISLIINRRKHWGIDIMIGLVLGLGLLSKLVTIGIVIFFVTYRVAKALRQRGHWGRVIRAICITLAIAAVIWSPWLIRNLYVYHSLLAEKVANVPIHWDNSLASYLSFLGYPIKTFWAVSGQCNDIAGVFPFIGLVPMIAAMWGVILLIQRKTTFPNGIKTISPLYIASFLATVAQIVLVYRFNYQYGAGQGRFLFLLLFPISLILGRVICTFKWTENQKAPFYIASLFFTYAATFTIYSIAQFQSV